MSDLAEVVEKISKEQLCSNAFIELFFISSKHKKELQKELFENFTHVMKKAREFGIADVVHDTFQAATADAINNGIIDNIGILWECPKPLEVNEETPEFPVDSLPDVLRNFLTETYLSVQVKPEMAALQMLSVLSLCVQGKALVSHPGGSHTEQLNLYTLTIAQPGERKSGVFRALTAPLFQYQKEENQRRQDAISTYKAEKASLERQLAGKALSPERMKDIQAQIAELKPVFPLLLNVTDATPEALSMSLLQNGERMGILDDEGGIFDVLSGLYSSGNCNIDIMLKGYDGSPYTVIRRSKENILLEHPILTVGLMTQQSSFEKAMQNAQFIGRGFMHRFLFAFPGSCAGKRSYTSPPISQRSAYEYSELIKRLLSEQQPEQLPVIRSNTRASIIFQQYYEYIEERMLPGGQFEFLKEWSNKQFARCLKIAGILHLCCHTAQEPIDENTAQSALAISFWAENQALRFFRGSICDDYSIADAHYVLDKILESGKCTMKMRELRRMCRRFHSEEEFQCACELLYDYGYAKEVIEKQPSRGRPSVEIHVNPCIFWE